MWQIPSASAGVAGRISNRTVAGSLDIERILLNSHRREHRLRLNQCFFVLRGRIGIRDDSAADGDVDLALPDDHRANGDVEFHRAVFGEIANGAAIGAATDWFELV